MKYVVIMMVLLTVASFAEDDNSTLLMKKIPQVFEDNYTACAYFDSDKKGFIDTMHLKGQTVCHLGSTKILLMSETDKSLPFKQKVAKVELTVNDTVTVMEVYTDMTAYFITVKNGHMFYMMDILSKVSGPPKIYIESEYLSEALRNPGSKLIDLQKSLVDYENEIIAHTAK